MEKETPREFYERMCKENKRKSGCKKCPLHRYSKQFGTACFKEAIIFIKSNPEILDED